MAKSFVYVSGKGSWVRAVTPDQWDCWSATLHPDAKSLEIIRDLQAEGMKNTLKKDDDGYYTKFRRPVSKMMRGKVQAFTPPEVIDKDGKPLDGKKIGNGSDITLKLDVYEHGTPGGGKAKAARLEAVRVDNLIEFNPDSDFTPDEAGKVEGLKDQPEPVW